MTSMADTRRDIVYLPLGAAAFGGAERSLLELASAQQAAGKRVLVAHERALLCTGFDQQAQTLGLPCVQVDWSPEAGRVANVAAAWRFFRGLDTRIIHFNISWRPSMWLVPLVARVATAAKLVGSMRATPERFSDLLHRRYFGVVPGPRVWAWPDYVIGRLWAWTLHETVSVNRDDYPPRLVKAFGFPAARLHVIYNGVRVPGSMPERSERAAARGALGLGPSRFVVAFVGRVSPEKGVHYLIDALVGCPPQVDVIIAGDGPQLSDLRVQAARLGLESRVRFLGAVVPPTPVFLAADAVAVPSLWNEAFGRVVVDAMDVGTLVIASAVNGVKEVFTDGVEGLLVPKADSGALAAAIGSLTGNPGRAAEVAKRRFERARAQCLTDRVSAQCGSFYGQLAA